MYVFQRKNIYVMNKFELWNSNYDIISLTKNINMHSLDFDYGTWYLGYFALQMILKLNSRKLRTVDTH